MSGAWLPAGRSFGVSTVIINKAKATETLYKAATQTHIDRDWERKVERLSMLCEEGVSKTHIAFLGTSILARAVDRTADLFYIKPKHAPDNTNAYSARSLCHSVMVPVSAELNFDIGVTGREPLNNQPYFRMTHLGDDTPVHAGGKEAFDYMVELVQELDSTSSNKAAEALAAFIAVRKRYAPNYASFLSEEISARKLIASATEFVGVNGEGGKRAQAVAAGLIDVFAGADRVLSGRINDPSRQFPGDVCVISSSGDWEKAFEVRDKPVSPADVLVFARKCVALDVREAAVVMVASKQDHFEVDHWAEKQGIGLTLFFGWEALATQCFFWSQLPTPNAARQAAACIHERLVKVEASPDAVQDWSSRTSMPGAS
jgi:hypothetical protein